MSIFTKTGAEAVASAQASKETKVSAHIKFPTNTTLKVRFLSANDAVEYYAHSLFGKVDTFAPNVTPSRNAKGYVTANPSLWDQASDLLYSDAKTQEEAGDKTGAEDTRKVAYLLKSKPKYLVGFVNLATGEPGFVDLTKKQQAAVSATLKKYANKLDKLAFELTKSGSSTDTVVSLTPIIDMDEDMTDKERENFAKTTGTEFDFEKFEGFVFLADEAEQTKNLVIAGFDIGRLGLSIGANANTPPAPSDNDAPIDISDEDLPF